MTKKAYLFLILTLLLGIILGVVLENLLEIRRFKVMTERIHEPAGFSEGIIQQFQLTEDQIDSLQPLLDNYAEISNQHREEARITHQAEMDSMFVKMIPYLNKQQVEMVNKILKEDGPDRPFMPWFGKPPIRSDKFGGPPPSGEKRPFPRQKPGEHERDKNVPPPPHS